MMQKIATPIRLSSALLLAAVAGCYSTSIPSVPCTTTGGCPTGQSCEMETGVCTATVGSCTAAQVVCGGTCNDASQCLQCLNGTCIALPDQTHTTLTADHDGLVADGSSKVTFTVAVKDANGHANPGVAVKAAASGSANTLAPTSGNTDANGLFTFTLTTTTAEAKTVTATITSGTSTVTKTLTSTFVAGPPVAGSSSIHADQTSLTASSGTSFATLSVTLADQFGNLASGVPVTFASSGNFDSASATTDSAGLASAQLSATLAAPLAVTAAIAPAASPLFTLTLGGNISVSPAEPNAAHTTLAADSNNVIADGTSVITYTATLRDAFGNKIALYGFNISATGSNNIFSEHNGGTDATGTATFTLRTTTAETKTVSINVALNPNEPNFTEQVTSTFIAGPAALATSTLLSDKTSAPADGSTPVTVTATILDTHSNPIVNAPVLFMNNGTSIGTAINTNASGVAKVTFASTHAGPASITAQVGPSTSPLTLPASPLIVQFQAGGPDVTKSSFIGDTNSVVADNQTIITYTATLIDSNGNAVPNQPVTVSASGSRNTLSATSGNTTATGAFIFTLKTMTAEAKTVTLSVGAAGTTPLFTKTAPGTFVNGPVSQGHSVFTASSTNLVADGLATTTLTAKAFDQFDNPVANITVGFTSEGTGNNVLAAQGKTNSSGIYSTTLSSTVAQAKNVSAKFYSDVAATNLLFALGPTVVTFNPGDADATRTTFTKSVDNVTADGASSTTVTLLVRDAQGNPLPNLAGVSITSDGASNTFSPATTTDVNGQIQATFSSTKAQVKNLVASIPRLNVGTALQKLLTITFVAGQPVIGNSSFGVSAATLVANGSASSTLSVALQDANHNTVPGYTVTFSVGGSGNTFSPSAPQTSSSTGNASTVLTSTVAEAKQVSATVSLSGTTTFTFAAVTVTFTPGDPDATTSTLTLTPTNAVTADNTSTVTIKLTAKDASGNLIRNQSGVTISATGTLNTFSPAATNNTVTGSTDANGLFSVTLVTKKAETKTITATIPKTQAGGALTLPTKTATFTAGPATGATSTLTASTGAITADGASAATLTLTVLDQFSNPVTSGYSFSATSSGATDVLGATWASQANGVSTDTLKSRTANATDAVTVTVTPSGGTAFTMSTSVNFVAGNPTQPPSSISASLTSVSADSATGTTISATFIDINNNPLLSKTVNFSASGSNNNLSAATGTTDNNGKVTFTLTSSKAENKTVTATLGGFQLSISISFVAGAATALSVSVSPTIALPVYADGSQSFTVTASVADAHGNPISSGTLSLSASGTQNTFNPGSGTPSSGGTFSSTLTSTLAQTETVTAAYGSVQQTSGSFTFTPTPWQPANTGIYGGAFASIAVDPTNTARVYIGGVDGVFKTTNSGGAWTRLTNTRGYVGGLVVDSTGVVYMATGTNDNGPLLYKSTDFGATWTAGTGGPINDFMRCIKQDPKTSSTLYAGGSGLWRSTDSGASWKQIGTTAGFGQVYDVEFDNISGHVYIATYNGGVFYSTDSGNTFASINGNIGDTSGGQLIVVDTGVTPTTLYYTKNNYPNNGTYVSTNNGSTWTKSTTIPSGFPYAMVIDPHNHNNWYIGGYSGYSYKSTSAGATWTQAFSPSWSTNISAIQVDPSTSAVIWEALGSGFEDGPGVYRSGDTAATWQTPNTGLTAMPVRFVIDAPSNHNTLYTEAQGCTLSTNGGSTWTLANSGIAPSYYISALGVDAINAQEAWVAIQYYGFYATTNGGTSWTAVANMPTTQPTMIANDTATTGKFYITDSSGSMWLTTNAASTFTPITTAPAGYPGALAIAKTDPRTMYLANANGIYKSTNAGSTSPMMTFTQISTITSGAAIAIDPTNALKVYVSTAPNSVLASSDGGATWTSISTGLPATNGPNLTSMLVDPVTTSTLYAAGYNAVYKYTGGAWVSAAIGLPSSLSNSYSQLAIDPTAPSTLWIGTGRGVYKTTTGAQ